MEKTKASIDVASKTLTFETGELARFSTASIMARLGDTMVLATVVAGREREDIDYFPLTVEYVERLYAGGRIKGSRWVKREGRPSDDAILTARLIDRSIRPLFPKAYKKEVQIIITVLSVDGENEPDILAINAVSAALAISPIPWNGPVASVRVSHIKENGEGGDFLINPGSETEFSDLDMVVTQTIDKTLMLEAEGAQVTEEDTLAAIEKAQAENKRIIEFINDFAKKVGAKKEEAPEDSEHYEWVKKLEKGYKAEIEALIKGRVQKESFSDSGSDSLINKIYEDEKAKDPKTEVDKKKIAKALEYVLFQIIRANTLKTGKRPDGRKTSDIRMIKVEVTPLPRTHGSAIFQRGDTQALTVVTLGSPRMEQLIESAEGEEVKRYIHHYSMPPYSVGEAGRIGTPSRREIGHGALAERALISVIPTQEVFPYTIRVVSEIILTDILGLEDFSGDMDFKVAGTTTGITAIQLDVKIPGLTLEQIKETFQKAKDGRLFILEKMLTIMPNYRNEVSEYAPKIDQIKIPVDKIGEVIGPGGKMIRHIIAQTGATVDVEDDGTVTISGTTEESVKMATDWVSGLTREVTIGENFEGEVKRILPFGAFVEILPGKEGMVHVSQMAEGFVKNPSDVVQIGEKVKVRVIEIDEQGRVNLSMKPPGAEPTGERFERRPARTEPRFERGERRDHPLAQQFRREREGQRRERGGHGARPFKKTHY
ncbi:MAG: polyribonucleotide nucleotidyltransferase [Candidatus Levybacteria bacterium]|nr:polyribonucleotide nucleotidyltransferase [Candidatus Levybacteria bacterium]